MTDVQEGDAGIVAEGQAKPAKAAEKPATEKPVAAAGDGAADQPDKGAKPAKGSSIATGAEATTIAPADFPTDWRERMAKDATTDDPRAYDKELKRLQRYASPSAVWQKAAELEAKLGQGGLVKIPGPKATDEDKAAFNKALGVPETPEGYVDNLKLANNRALGDADKPVLQFFASRLHPQGITPAQMSALVDAKFDFDQAQADAREELDDTFQRESETGLHRKWGGSYAATTTAIATMIQAARPEVQDFFMSGRSTDGRKVGNDPVMLEWLAEIALDKYPADTNRDAAGNPTGDRLEEIRKATREGKSTPEMEKEQIAIIEARDKRGKRSRAA